jgi:hypothetical protein
MIKGEICKTSQQNITRRREQRNITLPQEGELLEIHYMQGRVNEAL